MKTVTRPRGLALALLFALTLGACGAGADPEPSTSEGQVETSTTVKAPSVKVAKSYEDLAKALNIAAPEGYLLQPSQVGDTGPTDLAKASRDDGGDDAEGFLTRTGFVRGYQRQWMRAPGDDFIVYLYQFGTNAGAAEYTERLKTEATMTAEGVTLQPFDVPGIGGALGVNASDPTFASSSVTFAKGPYSVQVVVNSKKLTGLQALANAIAEEQYSRL